MAEEKKKRKKTTRKVGYADDPDLSEKPSGSERSPVIHDLIKSYSDLKVAMTAAALCLVFFVFVFVNDDFKASPLVQGTALVLVSLTVAVVLFSAVPSNTFFRGGTLVRVLLSVAGAAGFHLLLLTQIKPFVFPSYSFTGYVTRESGENIPVEGADVEIEGTGLRSITNSDGQFTISNIPSEITITHLVIRRGGLSYVVEANKYSGRRFTIPADPRVIKSSVYPVSSNEWTESSHAECISTDEKRFLHLSRFSLNKTVQNEEGFSDLVLRVWCDDDEVEIIEAVMQQPAVGKEVSELDGNSKAQKWQVPVEGRTTTISLYMCLASNRKQASPSKSKIQSVYWFEKVE